MKKTYIFLTIFFLTVSFALKAQTDFSLSGLGRVVVTDNRLDGNIIKNDLATPNKGVSGYILFDLKPTLKVNKDLTANAILRVKSPFGAFFGDQVAFEFRQFQVLGKINKNIDYQIGDINVEMTPYTVYAFPEMYNQFESEVHKIRRNIVNYENFVIGNAWRLQGVQGFANLPLGSTGTNSLYINVFGVRTNATNDANIPDRILVGTRVLYKLSNIFRLGGNYVGMEDIKLKSAIVNYVNHVYTGDAKLSLNSDAFGLDLKGETGMSSYNYSRIQDNKSASYNDYFYDVNAAATVKKAKFKIYGGYRNVGPQFSSPSAQTRRINITANPGLFPTVLGNTTNRIDITNGPTLYDRFTQENIYNRAINPVLYPFLPAFNLIFPYGDATPNRSGITAGIATDTSSKAINAEIRTDFYNEIIGEGVPEKRKFTGVRGGIVVDVQRIFDLGRRISVNYGLKYEKSTRGGGAAINFKSTLIDVGGSVEVLKKVDLLVGAKLLAAKGTEYLTVRDQFNLITASNSFTTFPVYTVDFTQNVYTVGARIRFAELSYFTVNYNISTYNSKITSQFDYNIRQFFVNYTLIIP